MTPSLNLLLRSAFALAPRRVLEQAAPDHESIGGADHSRLKPQARPVGLGMATHTSRALVERLAGPLPRPPSAAGCVNCLREEARQVRPRPSRRGNRGKQAWSMAAARGRLDALDQMRVQAGKKEVRS